MRSSFAKSIYVGAAVLGLAGLSAVTTTTASAKSYATAGAYTALADKSQNVTVTGTNAIYSKPGTVKGAKVVASKKTVAKLAASKKSSDTFYAYGTKTTNRGSVYYKIVTMDKKYRGYVYAGKTAGTFTAGIKAAETTTAATTPARTTGYYLKDASKNTLWTAPKNTDIHAKKVSLYGASKTDPFTVDKAATKTKEGSLYYHVTDTKDSSISGWIYAGKGYQANVTDANQDMGGLSFTKSADAATTDNSITVHYVLDSNSNSLGTATYTTSVAGTKKDQSIGADSKNLADFAAKNVPTGYGFDSTAKAPTAASVSPAKFGGTLTVRVAAVATSKVSFYTPSVDGIAAGTKLAATDIQGGFPTLDATKQETLKGDAGIVVPDKVLSDLFNGKKFTSTQKVASADITDATGATINAGENYYISYTYNRRATINANQGVKFGTTLKAVFTPSTVKGNVTTTNDNGNANYAE
ncbi:S-layer protein [Levilactobacillus parabrevis]|uniref:S-layer protein n=1 Tax=Levilactobacillus parabrevis TaxID=357278 RepID=UPI00288B9DCF|nr:S-layer protein [Levilactobacillus parabrevis]MCT4491131.1 S-layer protein [Levilactobacillus parabrevis]